MDNSKIVKVINPNLNIGEIIDNRYKVISFDKITPQDDLRKGGEGKVIDLLNNNRILRIRDVYDANWSEPKKYEKIVKLAPLINNVSAPFLTSDRFIWHNSILYRIDITIHESNEIHDNYSLYKRMCHRIQTQEKFTQEEIVEFIYWVIKIRKYLNSIGLDFRSRINHGNFMYIDGKIMYRVYYFDVTDKINDHLNCAPPQNIAGDYLWLLGGIIYEMASLKIENNHGPFYEMDAKKLLDYQKAKRNGWKKPRLPEFPAGYSQELVQLYERLIEVIPEDRPTMDDILDMDIMNSAKDSMPNPNWSKDYDSMGIGMMILYYDDISNRILVRKSNERIRDPYRIVYNPNKQQQNVQINQTTKVDNSNINQIKGKSSTANESSSFCQIL